MSSLRICRMNTLSNRVSPFIIRTKVFVNGIRNLHSENSNSESEIINNETQWQDVKQRKEIKSLDFYESNALKKQYFYHINLFGHLFIEDVLPKNITSCLKSIKFLDFFFSQIQLNKTGKHLDYPLISPCGKEMNYIKTADPYGAITFLEFIYDDDEKEEIENKSDENKLKKLENKEKEQEQGGIINNNLTKNQLLKNKEISNKKRVGFQFGGSKFQPLNPSSFVISKEGRLYHELTKHRYSQELGNLALIKSQVALFLCEHYVEFGDENDENDDETYFIWEDEKYLIKSFEQYQKDKNRFDTFKK